MRKFIKSVKRGAGCWGIDRAERKKGPPGLSLGVRILLYAATLIFCVLSVGETILTCLPYAADIGIYVTAAFCLTVSVFYLYSDLRNGIRITIQTVTTRNLLAGRVYEDYRFRAVFMTFAAFFMNLLYAFGNGIYALLYHSAWLGTLAAYYVILSMMRFTVVWQERNVCRKIGFLLIAMTVVLGVAVILLIHSQGGKHYSGFLIFAVAAYTFYKIIIAIINLIKVRKMRSPLFLAIRNIGYADALVSVLYLQTAMFAAFGEAGSINIQFMNGITGGVVCVMILIIGIYMTVTPEERK